MAHRRPEITAPRFDAKLSPEQKILQAINRLTFGARPGDIEEVRRLGVEKWIALQLHPERIAEDPELEARLKPLETIRMDDGGGFQQRTSRSSRRDLSSRFG